MNAVRADIAKTIRDLLDGASLDRDRKKVEAAAKLLDSHEFLRLSNDQQLDLTVLYTETFYAVTGAFAA